ncbi:MAG: hypothetical protein U0414_21325 [Polyangiaceae bacterium]
MIHAARPSTTTEAPRLASLDDGVADPELVASMADLASLPPRAHDLLLELLATRLDAMPEDQRDARLARLCRKDELDAAVARPAVIALAALFRAAAAANVADRLALESDLERLGIASPLLEVVLALYHARVGALRDEIVRGTIAAHGAVLTGAEWRIDTLGSSSRGRELDVPIALVTFQYQDGRESKRLTMQMLPEAVHGLRELCDHLLSR